MRYLSIMNYDYIILFICLSMTERVCGFWKPTNDTLGMDSQKVVNLKYSWPRIKLKLGGFPVYWTLLVHCQILFDFIFVGKTFFKICAFH